jgi:hypothetical protein
MVYKPKYGYHVAKNIVEAEKRSGLSPITNKQLGRQNRNPNHHRFHHRRTLHYFLNKIKQE